MGIILFSQPVLKQGPQTHTRIHILFVEGVKQRERFVSA